MAYTTADFWLVVEGVDPAKMLPQGAGFWTPYLGAAPGAKIAVSLKIRGKDLVSDDPPSPEGLRRAGKGSPSVWMQFSNETGQHRQRAFIVGNDDQGTVHHPELLNGSYEWKEITETIAAPEGAVRMALFLGMRPCKGKVNYDDININTASEEASSVARDILVPRLPLQRIKEAVIIDLSKLANRSLADDRDNDGVGGWTDQGSGADMRELKAGERRLGGVPFRLGDGPRSIVVLRSVNRTAGDLPERVTIPIGKKLDTLFFLHAAAWCPRGGDEAFRYLIHYADGKDVTLPVTGNMLADWTADPVVRFPLENDTFTTVAETVKNAQFRQGSIYRMEWGAPLERRGVEIKSIEFIGGGKCVPILLGITGVMEW